MAEKIKWEEYEHDYNKKGADWFWFILSGALIVLIISILMRNFLFGVFSIIAAFTIMLMGSRKPKKLNFSIEAKGIKIESKLYPYEELDSFWLNYDPPQKKEIILETKQKFGRYIKIPLGNIDPNLARSHLIKILKEEKHEESLMETIAEKLGF